jgi:putative hydrolase of the HAD superfamily
VNEPSAPERARASEPGPIAAVLFDFGGVITASPFDAFNNYEHEHGLPAGFIRSVNATNHLDNAWARLERNELGFDEFCAAFEGEASAAGGRVVARDLFATFSGRLRPEMVEAVRRCAKHFKTGLLTNNFVTPIAESRYSELREVLDLFDAVVESSVVGVRKPDERFYLMACDALGITPSQAVFLDDLGVNLKPARALGMRTIKVTDTRSAVEKLEEVVGIPLR